jgi:hypothetical protein
MIVNLGTAKALGLTIPEAFLLRANKLVLWHEAAVPAAFRDLLKLGESGCAIGAAVSSAHDP